jgi:hypothetical protein
MKRFIHLFGILVLGSLMIMTGACQNDSTNSNSAAPDIAQAVYRVPSIESHVEISQIVADSSGETHFTTEKVKWNYWFDGGRITTRKPVTSFQFYHLHKGLDMGLHPAPHKQFVLIIQGTLQIETSNGEQRKFSPGSVFLVTDIEGTRGHKSCVIGKEDVFVAVLAIP